MLPAMCSGQVKVFLILVGLIMPFVAQSQDEIRARNLGIPFAGTPGPLNAITDVAGVTVGHTTLISGDGKLDVGSGPVRTGVTAVHPRGKTYDPVFAGKIKRKGEARKRLPFF